MKRILPLLAVAITLCLLAAPDAQASCWRCSAGQQKCVYVYHPAWYDCVWNPSIGFCDLANECTPYGSPLQASLASEYQVVSVERLDEPSAPQQETLTASLQIPKTVD